MSETRQFIFFLLAVWIAMASTLTLVNVVAHINTTDSCKAPPK